MRDAEFRVASLRYIILRISFLRLLASLSREVVFPQEMTKGCNVQTPALRAPPLKRGPK